jgi:membrane-associated phospholipid phosphatase
LGAYANKEEEIINNIAIKNERNEDFPNFRTHVDDYMQYAPIVAGYAYASTVCPNKLWTYTKEVLINEAVMSISVTAVKHWSKVPSIVNGSYNAFPSGHTTQAFSAATLFNDNFAKGNIWLQTASYASASTVGVLRILNERHWASDVVAGAGFGILSAKLSEIITKGISAKKPHSIIINP